MLSTIQEVDREPYSQPDHKPEPVILSERVHHHRTDGDTEEWNDRHPRSAEGSRHIRVLLAQDNDTNADQDKGEERADAGHLTDDVSGYESGEESSEDHKQQVAPYKSAPNWVNMRECGRNKPVLSHREEDPRLPEQEHQDNRGIPGQDGDDHSGHQSLVWCM